MGYYPDNCTIEYALRRDEVISKELECVSANSHLETLCKQFEVDKGEFKVGINVLGAGALTPTQDKIEKWKYKKVSESREWDGTNNEFFKNGDKVDYSEEPIIVLYYEYGSESRTYILSGHVRTRKNLENKKDSIKAIVITTSNKNVHEAYSNIVAELAIRFGHQATIKDLDIIEK